MIRKGDVRDMKQGSMHRKHDILILSYSHKNLSIPVSELLACTELEHAYVPSFTCAYTSSKLRTY